MENSVLRLEPDLVTIFWGANDAVVESVLQYVPLAEYSSNIQLMIKMIKTKRPSAFIVLITPPPIDEIKLKAMNAQKGKLIIEDRTNDRTYQYVQACKNLGKKYGIPVVDTFTALKGETSERGQYLSDGLHLNQLGNSMLFQELVSVLSKEAPEFSADRLDADQPHWSAIEQSIT